MVNLTIRLNSKRPSCAGGVPGTLGIGITTPLKVLCGAHLVLSELPSASGVAVSGSLHSGAVVISGLGQKVRRQSGDKVHFCVRCNFPIAIYGRLVSTQDPCEHVFCLICAKMDITCYLCEERIMRIQKLEVLEGIFICGAAGCFRSFLSKTELEWHIRDAHNDLLPSKEPTPNKANDVPQTHEVLGQGGPLSSPLQSQPSSPPSSSWHPEQLPFVSQPTSTLVPASTTPEKQAKAPILDLTRDQLEAPSKRKKLELQLSGGAEKDKEKEREKDKNNEREREGQKQVPRDRDREHGQREHALKDREQSQRRERDRDRDRDREREREFQTQSHRDRDRELWDQQQHAQQQQGGAHYQIPPPPPPLPPPFQSNAHQPIPPSQQGVTVNSYPPQAYPPFHPQQQENRQARYDPSRHGPFLDPRMAVPPDYQENNPRARHLQQDGERARNMLPKQEGYGVMERQGIILPHFHGEYGVPPMGMPMGHQSLQGISRFLEGGHGGVHLPPPQKRGNFGHGETGMGHAPHMFGWGGPANFGGGPVHPQFMNWQPPQ